MFKNWVLASFSVLCAGWVVADDKLPDGFVHLSLVEPSIQQDMRYASSFNFVGTPIDGYKAATCILTKKAALALKRVQARLKPQGYSLKVYDCYRPKSAVTHFARWARSPESNKTKQVFYPNEKKRDLFKRGYIAKRSEHSRGSTVDLTLVASISIRPDTARYFEDNGLPCTQNAVRVFEEGVVDMGTRYDCLDETSGQNSDNVTKTAVQNRQALTELMQAEDFKGYWKEWWHFTLKDEPFKKTYFDFPIIAPDIDALLKQAGD